MAPKKRETQVFGWDITIPNPEMNWQVLQDRLRTIFKNGWFQLEKGSKNGLIHFQIRGILKFRIRMHETKGYTKDILDCEAHWSQTSRPNLHKYDYVTKDFTKLEGPWPIHEIIVPEIIRGKELCNWQLQLKDILQERNDRTIHVIIDPNGCNGKSTFTNLMEAEGDCAVIDPAYSAAAMKQEVYQKRDKLLYIFDLPRMIPKKDLPQMYAAIEQTKNCRASDPRYQSKSCVFKRLCNVVVMCNEMPDLRYLSKDRWKLWGLRKDPGQKLPTLIDYDPCHFEN